MAEERPGPRERVLAAAGALFAHSGVRAVGVDAIIERAGVAKASFYRHFPSKEALVVAWLQSDQARWLDRIRAIAARRQPPPREELILFFEALESYVSEPMYRGCPFVSTASELRDAGPEVRAALVDYMAEIDRYLLTLAAAAGLDTPEDLAVELRLLVVGVMVGPLVLGRASGAAEAIEAARTLVGASAGDS